MKLPHTNITTKGTFSRYAFVAAKAPETGKLCNVVIGWHEEQATWLRTSPIDRHLGNAVITESGSLYFLGLFDPLVLKEAADFFPHAFFGWTMLQA